MVDKYEALRVNPEGAVLLRGEGAHDSREMLRRMLKSDEASVIIPSLRERLRGDKPLKVLDLKVPVSDSGGVYTEMFQRANGRILKATSDSGENIRVRNMDVTLCSEFGSRYNYVTGDYYYMRMGSSLFVLNGRDKGDSLVRVLKDDFPTPLSNFPSAVEYISVQLFGGE